MPSPTTQDLPLAQVATFGTSEVLSALVVVSGLLTLFLGDDYGISENAEQWAAVMVGMATVGTSIARAIKHHGAATANAHVVANAPVAVPTVDLDDVTIDAGDPLEPDGPLDDA